MARKAKRKPQTQTEINAKATSGDRDLAYRSSEGVSGPLAVILAVIALVFAASFLFSFDWHYSPDLPTVTGTLPSPPPPATGPSNS